MKEELRLPKLCLQQETKLMENLSVSSSNGTATMNGT